MKPLNSREQRGKVIAEIPNQITRVDEHSYKVKSQSGNGEYDVISTEVGWICSCPDFLFRKIEKCKHIYGTEFSLTLRKKVESSIVIQPITALACVKCGSDKIVKKALRHNKYGIIQRFLCNSCGKRFSFNIGFERMKSTPEIVCTAMQLYFSGLSYERTKQALAMRGVKVSHVAVYKWVKKYISLMQKYLDQITPQVSDTWRTDELYVKIKGNMKYLFAMMDSDTRFWISQLVAANKGTSDVRPMFREAKEITEKRPKTLISDGAANFHEAYQKEFWTLKGPRTEHVQHIRLQGDMHNNEMERMNGEVRDREKVIRGIKKEDSTTLKGYQLYHNYIRPHMSLEGKTPAEMCGIKVEGENKWKTIIQNASHDPTVNGSTNDPKS
jgi:putative transposase